MDRKLGLEYSDRQHPATPAAAATGINLPDTDAPDLGSYAIHDPQLALMAGMLKHLSQEDETGSYEVVQKGQVFERKRIVLLGIANACDAAVDFSLGEGSSTDGPRKMRVLLPLGSPPQSCQGFVFARNLVVKQIFTTSGPSAVAQLTVAGIWASGQQYNLSFRTPDPIRPGRSISYTLPYTTNGSDSNNAGVATAIKNAWNAAYSASTIAGATSSGNVITLTAANPGSLVMQTELYTASTGTGTYQATPFSGALDPKVVLAFR